MVESIDGGRTEELSVNPEVSCCRTEELELGFRIAATEELELGSRMSATPLVGTAPLAAVPTATCVGSVGTRGTLPLMRDPP